MSERLSKLGLGTVQWGTRYGISNSAGQTAPDEVGRILESARGAGVTLLDTACAYGEAERVLGECGAAQRGYAIVTKTPPHRAALEAGDVARFERSFAESLRRLRCESVEALLVHSADNLLGANADRLWDALQAIREGGQARKIGVSAYHPAQLDAICRRFRLDVVQVPVNLFDQRFARSGVLAALHRDGVEVHARSAFLQGLLLMPPSSVPSYFAPVASKHAQLHRGLDAAGLSPLEGALRYCLAQPEIDHLVVGCESWAQVRQVLSAADGPWPASIDGSAYAVDDEAFVDPSRWPRFSQAEPAAT